MSTDAQDEKRQRRNLEALIAREYPGWPVEWYPEHGVSAYHNAVFDRPESKRLLADLQPGDVIVTDDQDRLSRGREDEQAALRVFVIERGATIHTVTQGVVGDDIASRIVWSVKGILANLESETKGHRIASAHAAAAASGRWSHGDVGPGYRFDSTTGELVATDDLALIREAGDRFLARQTYQQVCDFLNATLSDEALSRFKSGRVTRDRLRDWLSNPLYAGYIVRHRGRETEELHQGTHPAAWSIEKFEAIQRRLAEKRAKNASRTPRTWAFSGIAKCPTCGHSQRLHPVKNRYDAEFFYIRCAGDGCPERHHLPIAASFEANILTGLAAVAYALDDILADDPSYGEGVERENPDEIRAKLAEADAELATIQKELILTPSLRNDLDVAAKRQDALQARDTLAARLDRLVTEAKSHRDELRDLADCILSLGGDPADEKRSGKWAGHIREETVTLIDRDGERTYTIDRKRSRHRPTMLQVLDGWRDADFETRCAVIRQSLTMVRAGREATEYHFATGLPTPIIIGAPFESKRSPILRALEESGFGRTDAPKAEWFDVARPSSTRAPATRG